MPVFKESESKPEKMSPFFERRIATLDKLMVVICDFTDGPALEPDKPHSHPHEQISYVAEGELFLFLGEEKHHLTKGDVFTVPPDLPHCIQTLSEFVRLIDSFCPVREDFLNVKK
jgi:mannose-6-phosphate isomerase-like protein (cupin superfamily)